MTNTARENTLTLVNRQYKSRLFEMIFSEQNKPHRPGTFRNQYTGKIYMSMHNDN